MPTIDFDAEVTDGLDFEAVAHADTDWIEYTFDRAVSACQMRARSGVIRLSRRVTAGAFDAGDTYYSVAAGREYDLPLSPDSARAVDAYVRSIFVSTSEATTVELELRSGGR
jgi:hypothetical protein